MADEIVDHCGPTEAEFWDDGACKCDTHKALGFSTLRFGTRRSKVQILSPRPLFPSRICTLRNILLSCKNRKIGYIGYNNGFLRRNLKTQAHFCCDFLSIFHVFPELRISIRDCLVRVTEPETNKILWRPILAKPGCSEAAESVKPRLCLVPAS